MQPPAGPWLGCRGNCQGLQGAFSRPARLAGCWPPGLASVRKIPILLVFDTGIPRLSVPRGRAGTRQVKLQDHHTCPSHGTWGHLEGRCPALYREGSSPPGTEGPRQPGMLQTLHGGFLASQESRRQSKERLGV